MKVKKVLSLTLALVMLLTLVPTQLILGSAGRTTPATKQIGEAVTFSAATTLEKSGNYKDCVKFVLQMTVDYDAAGITEDEAKAISTFNQLVAVDTTVLEPVSQKSGSQGTSSLQYLIDNASSDPYNVSKGTAKTNLALLAGKINTYVEDDESGEMVPGQASYGANMSGFSYNADTKMMYINFVGNTDPGQHIWLTEGVATTVFTTYLRPAEGASLFDVPNAIRWGTNAEINEADGCRCDLYDYATTVTTGPNPNSNATVGAISFADDFYPVVIPTYTVTFNWHDNGKKAYTDVDEGTAITAPTATEIGTYEQDGFDWAFDYWQNAAGEKVTPMTTATGNETYTAVYKKLANDKSALEEEINNVANIKTADDYKSGWNEYQTALAAANDVLADENATKTDIANALAALQAAKAPDALVLKGTINITFKWQNGAASATVPTREGDPPTVPDGATDPWEDDTTNYTFNKWKVEGTDTLLDNLPAATQEATYVADYTTETKSVTLTFNYKAADGDHNGVTQSVKYGDPIEAPATGNFTRTEEGIEYNYTFIDWNPVVPATVELGGETTFTAQYNRVRSIADYTAVNVSKAAAEEVINSPEYAAKYEEGAREALENYLAGINWELPESQQTTVDAIATAIDALVADLANHIQKYTITYDLTGADDASAQVPYGASPADYAPVVPGYSDGSYDYTFNNTWTPAFANVTGEATYKANYDGAFVPASNIQALKDCIANAVAKRDDPSKDWTAASKAALNELLAQAAQYTDDTNVPGRAEEGNIANAIADITAFELIEQGHYTVTFYDWDGSIINQKTDYIDGDTVTAPDMTGKTRPDSADGNTSYPSFKCWTNAQGEEVEVATVPSDTSYYAKYNEVTNYAPTGDLQAAIANAQQKVDSDNEFDARYSNAADFKAKIAAAQQLVDNPPLYSESQTVIDATAALNSYELEVNKFTITWVNYNNAPIKTDENVPYGTVPVYVGATPTRDANAQYTYTFSNWTPAPEAIKADATYTADYSTTVNKYDITFNFRDANGNWTSETLLQQPYGTVITRDDPTSPVEVNDVIYTFNGWGEEIVPVAGEKTYTAQYLEAGVTYYTVTFYDWDGTTVLFQKNDYRDGDVVTAPDMTGKSRPDSADGNTSYPSFKCWTNAQGEEVEVAAAPSNTSYIAKYNEVTNYAPTGDLQAAIANAQQTVNGDNEFDARYSNAADFKAAIAAAQQLVDNPPLFSEKATVDAATAGLNSFALTKNKFNITFVGATGETLQASQFEYGEQPNYTGATPTKTKDAQFTYTFDGWTYEIPSGTGESVEETSPVYATADLPVAKADRTYTAHFDGELNKYTVYWVDEDGSPLETDANVPYGTMPEYNGEIPTKDATAQYTYTFSKWTPDVDVVEGDVTYTAEYSSVINKYTVTFKYRDLDGSWKTDTLADQPYGTVLTRDDPTSPVNDGTTEYTFTAWDNAIVPVIGNADYVAQYTEAPVTKPSYQINFVYPENVAEAESESYSDHNQNVYEDEMPIVPTPSATFNGTEYTYTFDGWDKQVVPATGAETYTAIYSKTPVVVPPTTYTINFRYADTLAQVKDGENADHNQTVNENEMPNVPTPEEFTEGNVTYKFVKWDKEVVPATGDETYTAVYQPEEEFIPDMTEVDALTDRYNEMVKTGLYNPDDLAEIKALIDDIYDAYDNDEFDNQDAIDEVADYLRYLENHARKNAVNPDEPDEPDTPDKPGRRTSPKNGDNATIVVMSVILVSSLGLAVISLKKRKKEF